MQWVLAHLPSSVADYLRRVFSPTRALYLVPVLFTSQGPVSFPVTYATTPGELSLSTPSRTSSGLGTQSGAPICSRQLNSVAREGLEVVNGGAVYRFFHDSSPQTRNYASV